MIINVDNIEIVNSSNRMLPPRFIIELVMVSGNRHELAFDILEDREEYLKDIAKKFDKIITI